MIRVLLIEEPQDGMILGINTYVLYCYELGYLHYTCLSNKVAELAIITYEPDLVMWFIHEPIGDLVRTIQSKYPSIKFIVGYHRLVDHVKMIGEIKPIGDQIYSPIVVSQEMFDKTLVELGLKPNHISDKNG